MVINNPALTTAMPDISGLIKTSDSTMGTLFPTGVFGANDFDLISAGTQFKRIPSTYVRQTILTTADIGNVFVTLYSTGFGVFGATDIDQMINFFKRIPNMYIHAAVADTISPSIGEIYGLGLVKKSKIIQAQLL